MVDTLNKKSSKIFYWLLEAAINFFPRSAAHAALSILLSAPLALYIAFKAKPFMASGIEKYSDIVAGYTTFLGQNKSLDYRLAILLTLTRFLISLIFNFLTQKINFRLEKFRFLANSKVQSLLICQK